MSKKHLLILIFITTVIGLGTVVWGVLKTEQEQGNQPNTNQDQQSIVENRDNRINQNNQQNYVVEDNPNNVTGHLITSEVDTSDWQSYRNEELGLSFQNPGHFYLFDRLGEKEKSLLISDQEIRFNEFLNGYFAPIYISRSNQEQDDNFIGTLTNKTEEIVIVDNEIAKIIKGVLPPRPPYHEFNTIVIISENRNVTIKINDVRSFAGRKVDFDIDQVASELLATIKWADGEEAEEWQIFTDQNWNVSFRYPASWSVSKSENKLVINSVDYKMGLAVMVEKIDQSLNQFVERYNNIDPTSRIIKQEQILLDKIPATKLLASTSIGIDNTYLYFIYEGTNYLIKYNHFAELHNEIISTLHLMD